MSVEASNSFAALFPVPPQEMEPTQEQLAIIDAKANPLKVLAFAGTGKTSTLELKAKANPNLRILYLAFNKSVEMEAKQRFPSNVTVKTIHALAWETVGRKYKVGRLAAFQLSKVQGMSYYDAVMVIRTIENFCNSADNDISAMHIAKDFLKRHKTGGGSQLIDAAKKVWSIMKQGENQDMPMTHSGYLKLFQLQFPNLPYNLILLDEAQDTNSVTQKLIMDQVRLGSEVILVGDENQSIYSWRGAVNALTKIKAPTLYLTQSFRFGQPIADVANKILSTYYNEKKRIQGMGLSGVGRIDQAKPFTFIARTNGTLFKKAYDLCVTRKLYIAGSVERDLPIFQVLIDFYHLWRNEKHLIKDPEIKCFNSFDEAVQLAEQECLDPEFSVSVRVVNEHGHRIPGQIEEIKQAMVLHSHEADVILTTTHKAKGLEWDRVIIAEDFKRLFDKEGNMLPMGFLDKEVPPEEINLLYVAATRAKRELQLNSELHRLCNPKKRPEKPEDVQSGWARLKQ